MQSSKFVISHHSLSFLTSAIKTLSISKDQRPRICNSQLAIAFQVAEVFEIRMKFVNLLF